MMREVLGTIRNVVDAVISRRLLAVSLLVGGLCASGETVAQSLRLRQFDSSRSPLIDIVAEIEHRHRVERVEVLELRSDQQTSIGTTRSAMLAPAAALINSDVYEFERPVGNIFFAFAGRTSDIADMADSHDFARAFSSALQGIQPSAIQIYVFDPAQTSMVRCSSPEQAADVMIGQAQRIADAQPVRIRERIANVFRSAEWISVDDVAQQVRMFATQNPGARNALAHTLIVFWAGSPDDDISEVAGRDFVQDYITITIGEISSGTSYLVNDRARLLAQNSMGQFLSVRDIRLRGRKLDYEKIISEGLSSWKKRVANMYIFTAETANLEQVENCWFEVGIPGSHVRQRVTCSRSGEVVDEGRAEHLAKLQARFNALISREDFRAAHDLIPQMRGFGADATSLSVRVKEGWQAHILATAEKGDHSVALQGADELNGTGLISRSEYALLREEVFYEAGQWAAREAQDQNRAMDLLVQWRQMAQQSGSYQRQQGRAAGVAVQMAGYLVSDLGKDAEFAAEINEAIRVDTAQAHRGQVLRLIGTWLTRNTDRYDVSARLALIDNWDLVLPALTGTDPASERIRRFFILSAMDGAVRENTLRQLRADSLNADAPVPGYVSLNRALVLAEPLVVALKSAARFGIEPAEVSDLLDRSRGGMNDRQAVFYRANEGLADANLLAAGPLRIVSARQQDMGYGIRLHSAFYRRLLQRGAAAIFEGVEGDRPVHVLLVPTGPESFIRIAFSDRIAHAVHREFRTAKAQMADKPQREVMSVCLNILDVRDAELLSHLGVEFLGQLIARLGVGDFRAGNGERVLADFHAAVPEGVRGFIMLDHLEARDGTLVRVENRSVRFPSDIPQNTLDRRISGASYALWDAPYFEVGLPLREAGERRVSGALTFGLRSIPR